MPRKAKPNRTDLALPKTTVPGQEYGKQAEQMRAQQIVPMGETPVAQPGPQNAVPAPSVTPPPQPGSLPWLHPTNRPMEPVTHGLDVGPGAGREALGALGNVPAAVSAKLSQLAEGPYGSPAITRLAEIAQQLGY